MPADPLQPSHTDITNDTTCKAILVQRLRLISRENSAEDYILLVNSDNSSSSDTPVQPSSSSSPLSLHNPSSSPLCSGFSSASTLPQGSSTHSLQTVHKTVSTSTAPISEALPPKSCSPVLQGSGKDVSPIPSSNQQPECTSCTTADSSPFCEGSLARSDSCSSVLQGGGDASPLSSNAQQSVHTLSTRVNLSDDVLCPGSLETLSMDRGVAPTNPGSSGGDVSARCNGTHSLEHVWSEKCSVDNDRTDDKFSTDKGYKQSNRSLGNGGDGGGGGSVTTNALRTAMQTIVACTSIERDGPIASKCMRTVDDSPKCDASHMNTSNASVEGSQLFRSRCVQAVDKSFKRDASHRDMSLDTSVERDGGINSMSVSNLGSRVKNRVEKLCSTSKPIGEEDLGMKSHSTGKLIERDESSIAHGVFASKQENLPGNNVCGVRPRHQSDPGNKQLYLKRKKTLYDISRALSEPTTVSFNTNLYFEGLAKWK